MMFARLRAKSGNGLNPSEFLPQHLIDAYNAAKQVLASTVEDQLQAFGLQSEQLEDRFRRIVLLAAAVHDLGKANDHFQGMIHKERDVRQNPQGIRHEWVSLLMLRKLAEWLLPALDGSAKDFAILEWAVVGHHPAHNHESPPNGCPQGSGADMTLLMNHHDFRDALRFLEMTWELGPAPLLSDERRELVGGNTAFTEIARWFRSSRMEWDRMKNMADRRLVAAVKDTIIAADIAGSAIPKSLPDDETRWNWIAKAFAAKPEPDDLQLVVDHRLRGGTPREFQRQVAGSTNPITFVKAGCGTGKTLAAYMWAAANYPTRRLYFCYPTTGTATEGFRDYLFDPAECIPRIGAKLFHSRADVDFEVILNAATDTPKSEEALRLESLEAWSTPVVACTVDTVLGIVQNNKRGLFAWPALAQAAFVFDEIHAFDDSLFGALLRFLRDVPGLPVLLMTASLPAMREAALRTLVESQGREWRPIAGPQDLETRARYRKELVAANDPLPAVRRTLSEGGKVLWVCNTVNRVMANACSASANTPIVYHSRFKYEDRVKCHKQVIEAFNPQINPGAALAICTQVAEMSLDLSADLLVTDLAPVPALIQRLGRLNRRANDGDLTRPFIVVEPQCTLPYTDDELTAARAWLAKLPDDGISQNHLSAAWEQATDQPATPGSSAWLDGGPVTRVNELREPSPGVTVLMSQDIPRIKGRRRDLARLVLPMPRPPSHLNWREWPRESGIPVAPTDSLSYDPLRGAEWQKK